MFQVFISYITPYAGYHPERDSSRDLAFVEQLAADSQATGLEVWIDLSGWMQRFSQWIDRLKY
jgi:hypothetical protein